MIDPIEDVNKELDATATEEVEEEDEEVEELAEEIAETDEE